MVDIARALLEICHAAGVPLIINDRVDVAMASGADGVHVGQSDMLATDARRLLGPAAIMDEPAAGRREPIHNRAVRPDRPDQFPVSKVDRMDLLIQRDGVNRPVKNGRRLPKLVRQRRFPDRLAVFAFPIRVKRRIARRDQDERVRNDNRGDELMLIIGKRYFPFERTSFRV